MKILPDLALTYDDVLLVPQYSMWIRGVCYHQELADKEDHFAVADRFCEHGCGDRE